MDATKGEQSVNDNIVTSWWCLTVPNELRRRNAKVFHRCGVPTRSEYARRDDLKRFYNLRASEEVCP